MVSDVTSYITELCDRRRLTCLVERIHDAGAVQCSPALVGALSAAVKESEQVSMLMSYMHIVYSYYMFILHIYITHRRLHLHSIVAAFIQFHVWDQVLAVQHGSIRI